jgi:hypothetical protein
MNSNPGYAALSITPKLKSLRLAKLATDMPLHVCPALRSVVYISLRSNLERNERNRLQSQGYIVMYLSEFPQMVNLPFCEVCKHVHD